MYRLGKQLHRHRKGRRIVSVLLLLVLFLLLIYWLTHLRITPSATIRNAPPASRNYDAASPATFAVTKPEFSVEFPAGWVERTVIPSPIGPKYTFAAPSPQAKQFDIYIDNPPTNLAINKAIAVSAQGDGMTHDRVSENCITYTDPKSKNPQTGNAPARWQEINFICDMSNTERQVVGAISRDGMNQIAVSGPKNVAHKVFVTYTDNDISPDYTVFYGILNTLHFK